MGAVVLSKGISRTTKGRTDLRQLQQIEAVGRKCTFQAWLVICSTQRPTIRLLQTGGIQDRQAEAIAEALRAGLSGGIARAAIPTKIRIDPHWLKQIGVAPIG